MKVTLSQPVLDAQIGERVGEVGGIVAVSVVFSGEEVLVIGFDHVFQRLLQWERKGNRAAGVGLQGPKGDLVRMLKAGPFQP